MVETTATIQNTKGIHARPSSALSKAAMGFDSDIIFKTDSAEADPTNVLQLLIMELLQGVTLTITANGSDEVEALAKMKELVETVFTYDT